jgi:uncharacterized paraquat-inducible protein A
MAALDEKQLIFCRRCGKRIAQGQEYCDWCTSAKKAASGAGELLLMPTWLAISLGFVIGLLLNGILINIDFLGLLVWGILFFLTIRKNPPFALSLLLSGLMALAFFSYWIILFELDRSTGF